MKLNWRLKINLTSYLEHLKQQADKLRQLKRRVSDQLKLIIQILNIILREEGSEGALVKEKIKFLEAYGLLGIDLSCSEMRLEPESYVTLGLCYEHGLGVQKNHEQAMEHYKKAAESGSAWGQYQLGLCYELYQTKEKDHLKKAIQLYQEAANQKLLEATHQLGICYIQSAERLSDPKRSAEFIEQGIALLKYSAVQELAAAQYSLGVCCERNLGVNEGLGLKQRMASAVEFYAWSAKNGYPEARYRLGICYQTGQGVQQDLKRAAEFYRQAADQGYPASQYYLALCYEKGTGVQQDLKLAIDLCHQAANQGYAKAQYYLGHRYEKGLGVSKDLKRAVEFYQAAAKQGFVLAIYKLGLCYQQGVPGVLLGDLGRAQALFTEAARQGLPEAQCIMGYWHLHGIARGSDQAIGIAFLQKAQKDSAYASYTLGVCYELGITFEKDSKKAAELFTRAAEKGLAIAQHRLAMYYTEGLGGLPQDLKKAGELFLQAAPQMQRDSEEYHRFQIDLMKQPRTAPAMPALRRSVSIQDLSNKPPASHPFVRSKTENGLGPGKEKLHYQYDSMRRKRNAILPQNFNKKFSLLKLRS